MVKVIIFLNFIFFINVGNAFELEGFVGAQTKTFDESPDANSTGVSVRTKLNFYHDHRGVFLNVHARGISLLAGDFFLGYGWRTKSTFFLEGGLGLATSLVYGSGLGVLAGFGYRITNNFFVNFPITVGNSGIYWAPNLGYEF